jgi:hypothetical protein
MTASRQMAVGWRGSNAMPISIELKPEVEERLGREALAKGVSVEGDYLLHARWVNYRSPSSKIVEELPLGG